MTISVILHEWQQITPDTVPELKGFFLSDIPQLKTIIDVTQDAIELIERRDGLVIRAKSYIGRIRLGEMDITIRPKIHMSSLLNLLRYAYNLRDLRITYVASQKLDETSFQDILIQQLIIEVEELLSRGLTRNYVRHKQSLSSPRGRIDFQHIAKQGGIIEAALPCEYHPRLADNILNQILLASLKYAAYLTTDISLRVQARRLIKMLELEVSNVELTWDVLDLAYRQLTRLNQAYESVLILASLLFEGFGITIEDGTKHMKLPGFLFDMNAFWETLLSRFLRDNLPDHQVREQHRTPMMQYAAEYNSQKRRNPISRPDYIVFQEGKIVSILDAKYIDLWNNKPDTKILYQLGMYALGHDDVRKSVILYPSVNDQAQLQRINIRDAVYNTYKGMVFLIPVNLYALEELVSMRGYEGQQARTNFAETISTAFEISK